MQVSIGVVKSQYRVWSDFDKSILLSQGIFRFLPGTRGALAVQNTCQHQISELFVEGYLAR